MAFTRGQDAKEALGIGEAPALKEIREHLNDIITNRITVWSTHNIEKYNDDIVWKHIPSGAKNNMHRLVGVTQTHDPGSLKEHIRFIKHDIKGVFNKHDRKLTMINFYTTQKWFGFFKMEKLPNAIIMEIIFSRVKVASKD